MTNIKIIPCRFTKDFQELDGSPTENIASDLSPAFFTGTNATRVFRCASRDRMRLAREFLGYRSGVVYRLPHSYSDIDNIVVATSIAMKPAGKIEAQDDARFANYPCTDITVTYSIPPETMRAFGSLVTVTETMREASEFITCANQGLFWYVDGITNEQTNEFDAPGIVNHLTEWTYEIRGSKYIPAGVWGHPGSVNQVSAYSRTFGRTFPPETVLCCSPEVTQEKSFSDLSYTIRLRFLIKNNGTYDAPRGWNHFPRRSDTTDVDVVYERMVRAIDAPNSSAGWKIFYPLADFSDIYVP